jgi:hypothetical protein
MTRRDPKGEAPSFVITAEDRALMLRHEIRALEFALLDAITAAEHDDLEEMRRTLSAVTMVFTRVLGRSEAGR